MNILKNMKIKYAIVIMMLFSVVFSLLFSTFLCYQFYQRKIMESPLTPMESPRFSEMLGGILAPFLPICFLFLVIAIMIANSITRPIQQMTKLFEGSFDKKSIDEFEKSKIGFYEMNHLSEKLHRGISILKGQSIIDPLTGIMNRRIIDEVLTEWSKNKRSYSIIMIDLDNFKNVNDQYGHTVGDKVLKFFAEMMKNSVRNEDTCCRYGGEEFVILLPNTSSHEAHTIAEKIRSTMAETITPCGRPVTISAGISTFPEMASTLEQLIECADKALYNAKLTKNCVCTSTSTPFSLQLQLID